MKPRTSEAARLEKDYLDRVRTALAGRDPAEIDDVLLSLREHIEEEVGPDGDEEVRLSRMAAVLERLGPPESYAPEIPERPSSPPLPPPPAPAAPDARGTAEVLDRVWIGYFISILGLYVPIVDLPLCNLIGSIVLAAVLLPSADDEFRGAGRFAAASGALLLGMGLVGFAALAVRELVLLALPLLFAQLACGILAYWKLMGRTAAVVLAAGLPGLGERLLRTRQAYVIYCVVFFVVLFVTGAVLGVALDARRGNPVWWVGFLFLPVTWFFGWRLVLRPLAAARAALASPLPSPAAHRV